MRIVGAVAGLSLLAGCEGSGPRSFGGSGGTPAYPADAWVVVATPSDAGDASINAYVDGADLHLLEHGGMLGPDPPATSCGDSAPACPSPPPACVDSHFAVLYSGGQCMGGLCSWTKFDFDCGRLQASCGGAAGIDGGVDAAAPDGSVWVNKSGCLLQAPAGPDPMPVACDVDASPDGGVCPLPSSVCADSSWLVYYDNGRCAAGSCVWQKNLRDCNGTGCHSGACVSQNITAPAPN